MSMIIYDEQSVPAFLMWEKSLEYDLQFSEGTFHPDLFLVDRIVEPFKSLLHIFCFSVQDII